MRVLVFGGFGQLGTDLVAVGEGRHEVLRPSHSEVDVTDPRAVERTVSHNQPDAVVNAAAFHKVEQCEQDPVRSFAVNAVGALNVARACASRGARCVYVSTDYVFDGENPHGYLEDDHPSPLNVYGVTKSAGERLVQLACPDSLVARGSGLFGHAGSSGKGGNFVETMLSKAAAGEVLTVVDDQIFSPTATRDMAERLFLLLERAVAPGVYHVANAGSCSWYGFAERIFELARVEADLSPRPTGPQVVRRPRSSILLDTKSSGVGLPPNRPWDEALRTYLQERPARSPEPAGRSGS